MSDKGLSAINSYSLNLISFKHDNNLFVRSLSQEVCPDNSPLVWLLVYKLVPIKFL